MQKPSQKNKSVLSVCVSLLLMLTVSGCTQSTVSENEAIETIAPPDVYSAMPTTEPIPLPTTEPIPLPTETKYTQECTAGYDPCLPPASDYDCSGGSGNGPAFTGYVRVSGPDIYDLDRDGDGYGCD